MVRGKQSIASSGFGNCNFWTDAGLGFIASQNNQSKLSGYFIGRGSKL
jgi:hypothetical protein